MGARVVSYPLIEAGKQIEVVGLAGVRDRVRLGEESALSRERIDVRRGGRADDFAIAVILFNDNHDVIGAGHSVGYWRSIA